MWWCPWSHCCSMASLWSSADCACMACSWWAADICGGRPPCSSRGYGVPGGGAKKRSHQGMKQRWDWSVRYHILVNKSWYWPRTYRRLGGAASRVRLDGRGERWGWRRAGKGSGPGGVRLPGGPLPGGGPQNLTDRQDIHPHLRDVSVVSIASLLSKLSKRAQGPLYLYLSTEQHLLPVSETLDTTWSHVSERNYCRE